jgi:hemerythrin-like domain-containing protein
VRTRTSAPEVSPADAFEVLDACHHETLERLHQLEALVAALAGGGAIDAAQEVQARRLIEFFTGTARTHNADEERHVFPVLRDCDDEALVRAVDRLSEDHAWIEIHWLDVQAQLDAALAGSRSFDPAALGTAAEPFLAISREHIVAEERLLYPQARERMQPKQLKSMARELSGRATRQGR